jgi:thiamine-monophosphate kinase
MGFGGKDRVCSIGMSGMTQMGELALIQRIRARNLSRNSSVRLGIGDDCAVLRVPAGCEMVVTTDFSLEGRHFRRDWHSPQSAGHRCLARGLSDVAAMGGKPLAAFLSLALPKGFDLGWVDGFLEGFGALAARFGVELAGGDTSEAPGEEILADVMVVGAAPEGKALLRSGARVGDWLYVTGSLGGSAVELAALNAGERCPAAAVAGHPQTFPEPRLEVGAELLGLASACMDLSDGLSTDLRRMCEASGVGADISGAAIPLGGETLEQALHGGEDYELLFAAGSREKVPEVIAGVRVTRIGRVTAGAGVLLDGADLPPGGWEHLRG